jgi:hypothetical protein
MQHYALERTDPNSFGDYQQAVGPFKSREGAIRYLFNGGYALKAWDIVPAKKRKRK